MPPELLDFFCNTRTAVPVHNVSGISLCKQCSDVDAHVQLAAPRMMNEPLRIDRPFDVWHLGVLVYETVQGQEFWRPNLSEAAILHILASKDMQLPHESNPLCLDNAQTMPRLMLARSPDERPKHDGLKEVLEDHDKSGTVGVWSNHPSHPNAHALGVTVDLPV